MLLEGFGVVEVEDGDEGSDARGEEGVDELVVVGEAGWVGLAFTLGKHPGPANGKAVGVEAEVAHVGDVFGVPVVGVVGDGVGAAVLDVAWDGLEGVEDGATRAVGGGCAFDLDGGGGGSPEKGFREGGRDGLREGLGGAGDGDGGKGGGLCGGLEECAAVPGGHLWGVLGGERGTPELYLGARGKGNLVATIWIACSLDRI